MNIYIYIYIKCFYSRIFSQPEAFGFGP